MRVGALTTVAAILVAACGSRTGLFEPAAAPPPCEFADGTNLLDLANDTSLTAQDYVRLCRLPPETAAAIVSGRHYRMPREVPLGVLDPATCESVIACARDYEVPCTPTNHPTVVLELVVDESGSMTGEKWQAMRDSLLTFLDDIAADNDSALRVGLVMFDDTARSEVVPAALEEEQRDLLRKAVDKPQPHGGGTSTHQALQKAYSVANDTTGGVRRVLVLLSDGSPTNGDIEKEDCIALAGAERDARDTSLFSVGIGAFPSPDPNTYDPAFMGRLARAGGTSPAGCDPESNDEAEICHYQVTPGGSVDSLRRSFGAALDAIRESATTCP